MRPAAIAAGCFAAFETAAVPGSIDVAARRAGSRLADAELVISLESLDE
jgi:hypothetical protein